MQNLEQIRAAVALQYKDKIESGREGGEVAKKVPAMIMENGLLATLASALERNRQDGQKNQGQYDVFCAVLECLRKTGAPGGDSGDPNALLKFLTDNDSVVLRLVTAETIAFLNYLRRFARKKGGT